jgi:hypothetical protein
VFELLYENDRFKGCEMCQDENPRRKLELCWNCNRSIGGERACRRSELGPQGDRRSNGKRVTCTKCEDEEPQWTERRHAEDKIALELAVAESALSERTIKEDAVEKTTLLAEGTSDRSATQGSEDLGPVIVE